MSEPLRVPPYLSVHPRQDDAARWLCPPVPGPAVVVVWPDAPSEQAMMQVARAVEWALRRAWPPVPTDDPVER